MTFRTISAAMLLAAGLTTSLAIPAQAQLCGHYVILGCFDNPSQAFERLEFIGGPAAGGGAGSKVIDTTQYPNFRNGWYCVADGPYNTREQAQSIAWKEMIRDAYVKNAC